MKKIYIECRECNTYFEIDEKNQKYRCPMCSHKEDLVVINEKNKEKDK
ncbi:Sec23/Sec24 zinc finger-containing protein [Paraclostridium tenue]|uniref:Zinc finger Sec23/Sec24-type domain-containing protein n=1 Tax=Paraclostridium tenue TaxID=1737 RepID=A0ABP3XK03_9FIRM